MAKKSSSIRFTIRRESGHAVLEHLMPARTKISDVEMQRMPDGMTRLVHKGQIVAWSTSILQDGEKVTLEHDKV